MHYKKKGLLSKMYVFELPNCSRPVSRNSFTKVVNVVMFLLHFSLCNKN